MSVFSFIIHLIFTLGAWVFPFLVRWQVVVLVFGGVLLQFAIFGKCLLNEKHGLEESDDKTFYSFLLEYLGFKPNRKRVKFFVRQVLYIVLSIVAVIWQVVLGHSPLWF